MPPHPPPAACNRSTVRIKATGWIASARDGIRLVASPPQAGLAQLARPDPSELSGTTPMGHLSYALQWFAFALTALLIYALALAKKWRAGG